MSGKDKYQRKGIKCARMNGPSVLLMTSFLKKKIFGRSYCAVRDGCVLSSGGNQTCASSPRAYEVRISMFSDAAVLAVTAHETNEPNLPSYKWEENVDF